MITLGQIIDPSALQNSTPFCRNRNSIPIQLTLKAPFDFPNKPLASPGVIMVLSIFTHKLIEKSSEAKGKVCNAERFAY